MKKTLFYMAAIASTVLALTSCQKENLVAHQGFTAKLETGSSNSKTTLVGNTIQWVFTAGQADQVKIFDNDNNVSVFTAAQHPDYSDNPTYASLNYEGDEFPLSEGTGVQYKAIYPASIASTSSSTITLPQTQVSNNGELTEYPMYAESSTKQLQFKNLCSVLKLSLKGSGKVSKIVITTDQYINGTFTISNPNTNDENNAPLSATSATTHTAITTLELRNPQTLSTSTAKEFYIYVPAGNYNYLKIDVYDEATNTNYVKVFTKKYKGETVNGVPYMRFKRSKYHELAFNNVSFKEAVGGEFTIVETGTNARPPYKIIFSRGNVLNNGASSPTYHFASEQKIYRESTTASQYGRYLYTFGTDGTTPTPWESRTVSNETGWRAPTCYELHYILNSSYAAVPGRGCHYRWALIKIGTTSNNTAGMVLFPDDFFWPTDQFAEPSILNAANSNPPIYSNKDWEILENSGCVFLPAAGWRGTSSLQETGTAGYYWTSSPSNRNTDPYHEYAFCMHFVTNSNTTFKVNDTDKKCERPLAFRLVRTVSN